MRAEFRTREALTLADEQPGLRMRIDRESRRISAQHRQLDSLHALVARALERSDVATALQCFVRFKDALDAHMSLEDDLYFPALHGLEPDLEAELLSLAREHRRFRDDLGELEQHFATGDAGSCQRRLDRFVDGFAAHELREEELARTLKARAPARDG